MCYYWCIERCEFNTLIKIEEFISSEIKESESYTIDITDHNTTNQEISYLLGLSKTDKIFVTDTNWFGGVWTLDDFIKAEAKLDNVVSLISDKNYSPFERFIFAYHFASNREYKFAPKGSQFQACRSYVNVLNSGYCVCVGYATVLKRLCEKLGIECAVQGCLAKDRFGKVINHANNSVYLKDDKYQIDGIFYSDPRMDCLNFADIKENDASWKLNSLAIPITEIGKIIIKVWNDDTIIEMNDFQSLYYSRQLSESDKEYLSKFFSKPLLEDIMSKKYCKPIEERTLFLALKQLGLDESNVEEIENAFYKRRNLFFSDVSTNQLDKVWDKRLTFAKYVEDYINHSGRKNASVKMDCATFVRYMYKNFFNIDILQGGIGKSWTGKILTSILGKVDLIGEDMSMPQKINFIDRKCKIGDILLFHRQSASASASTSDNWYPGHCGIYLGNHKYIDSRLTTRGDIAIVNIESDNYMENFIGCKDIISSLDNLFEFKFENSKEI